MSITLRQRALVIARLASASVALGYLVGPPLSLEKLATTADIIFKGTVVSSEPVQDEWFKPYAGFVATEIEFGVISVPKGEAPGATLRFRHYNESKTPQGRMTQPLFLIALVR